MITILLALLMVVAPFWDTKQPADWTDVELEQMLADSPWAQVAQGPSANLPAVQVYLATAKPVQLAEAERERRKVAKLKGKEPEFDPFAEEYAGWLAENSKDQIILALKVGNRKEYNDTAELDQLEKESVMRVGRAKVPMTGYFPPSSQDPYLRIAFPRKVPASEKTLKFELYLPGVSGPFRTVEFRMDGLKFVGKAEF